MKNKVLVVGGAGYIGGIVVDQLKKQDYDVTVFDNLLFEERYLKDVKFIHGDITETEKVVDVANKFDYVIWMAALVGDPACEVDPLMSEWINHVAVRDFCKALDPHIRVIFYSTCSVYGINEGLLTETSEVNPISVYGKTKYAAEEYVLARHGIVFRLGTVYGLGDEHSRLRLDLVVNVMTMKAYLDKQITVNGGEQWRPIISATDVANFTVAAVGDFTPGIYNLVHRNVTISSLGLEISELLDVPITFNDLPYQDLRNYMADGSKAINTFNYTPCVTVEDEVRRIYKVISENRIKDLNSLTYHNGQYLKHQHDKVAAKV